MTGRVLERGAVNLVDLPMLETALDQLPDVPYFVKDASLRYVSANVAMLDLCGARTRSELIGTTSAEFFPTLSVRHYESLDHSVLRTLHPVRDRLERTFRKRGNPVWLLFSRCPVLDQSGKPAGVLAVARRLRVPKKRQGAYERLSETIEHLRENIAAPFDVGTLAQIAGVSVSQTERDFVALFGMPPRRYLTKLRFEAARDMLRAGWPVVDVAHACGYADQSAFTRRFRSTVGMSPTQFKARNS